MEGGDRRSEWGHYGLRPVTPTTSSRGDWGSVGTVEAIGLWGVIFLPPLIPEPVEGVVGEGTALRRL